MVYNIVVYTKESDVISKWLSYNLVFKTENIKNNYLSKIITINYETCQQ